MSEEINWKSARKYIIGGLVTFSSLVGVGMWGCPQYKVYEQELEGKAELQKAEWNRQIKVREAQANLEAQRLNAEAEVARADGVAKANKIIGHSLKENEEYLRYLFIQNLGSGNREIIYVPTEANLPILEANRLRQYNQESK